MTGMVRDIAINKDHMRDAAALGYTTATDLADWLVRVKDVPFRDAHHIAGQVVQMAEQKSCGLDDLSADDLATVDDRLTADVQDMLSVEASVKSRTSFGGTAPDNVRMQIGVAKTKYLDGDRS